MSTGRLDLGNLPAISGRRRNTDRAMRGLMWVACGIALVPLVLIVYYLIHKGIGTWNSNFFTTDPNGNFFGNHGGIRSAILGSLELIAIASAIAIPAGIGVALFLTE
jgi:phosphate transport system permease protein